MKVACTHFQAAAGIFQYLKVKLCLKTIIYYAFLENEANEHWFLSFTSLSWKKLWFQLSQEVTCLPKFFCFKIIINLVCRELAWTFPVRQVSRQSYLPHRKIYLPQMIEQDFFQALPSPSCSLSLPGYYWTDSFCFHPHFLFPWSLMNRLVPFISSPSLFFPWPLMSILFSLPPPPLSLSLSSQPQINQFPIPPIHPPPFSSLIFFFPGHW